MYNSVVFIFLTAVKKNIYDNTDIFVWWTEFIQIDLISEFETNRQTKNCKQTSFCTNGSLTQNLIITWIYGPCDNFLITTSPGLPI